MKHERSVRISAGPALVVVALLTACAGRAGEQSLPANILPTCSEEVIARLPDRVLYGNRLLPEDSVPVARLLATPEADKGPSSITDPALRNGETVSANLKRHLVRGARHAGARATDLAAFVDADGMITRTHVLVSSGDSAFDAAAVRVVESMRFTPAVHEDCRLGVWLRIPITYASR
jgi:TonB family protein